jgi:hypothetical protein
LGLRGLVWVSETYRGILCDILNGQCRQTCGCSRAHACILIAAECVFAYMTNAKHTKREHMQMHTQMCACIRARQDEIYGRDIVGPETGKLSCPAPGLGTTGDMPQADTLPRSPLLEARSKLLPEPAGLLTAEGHVEVPTLCKPVGILGLWISTHKQAWLRV